MPAQDYYGKELKPLATASTTIWVSAKWLKPPASPDQRPKRLKRTSTTYIKGSNPGKTVSSSSLNGPDILLPTGVGKCRSNPKVGGHKPPPLSDRTRLTRF